MVIPSRSPHTARRLRSGLAILLAAASAGVGAQARAAVCRASLAFEPETAVVGQQVLLRIRVQTQHAGANMAWSPPAPIDGAWLERLPDRIAASGTTREIRHAVFPLRPGEIRIEASRVACGAEAPGSDATETTVVPLPGATLRVERPPKSGAPEGFDGTLGPVELHAVAVPEAIALGQSVRLAVMVRGPHDLRNLADPLPELRAVEIFRRPTEVSIETGERLALVRHFAYDLVPNEIGRLELPPIRLAYYDPEAGRFASATSEPIAVRVAPRSPAQARPDTRGESIPPTPARAETPPARRTATSDWIRGAAAGVGVLVAAAAAWHAVRRRRRRTALVKTLGDTAAWDAAVAERVLRSALEPWIPDARTLAADEIARLPDLPRRVRATVDLLRRVERARFDPRAELPDRAKISAALQSL